MSDVFAGLDNKRQSLRPKIQNEKKKRYDELDDSVLSRS